VEQLKLSNANHVFLKTSDGHEWKLWREYLPEFLKISVGKQQQPRISSSGQ